MAAVTERVDRPDGDFAIKVRNSRAESVMSMCHRQTAKTVKRGAFLDVIRPLDAGDASYCSSY